jgi:hypothetical protein
MSTTALWVIAGVAALAAAAFGTLAYVLHRQAAASARSASEERDQETQRLRDAAWFAATLELDALALRIVEAALAACDADGTAIALRPVGNARGSFEALHLAPAEIEWISRGLEAESAGAAIMRYPDVESQPGEERIKTALFVAIPGLYGEPSGSLAAAWRRDLGDGADQRLAILEGVANSAWPALENARKYEQATAPRIRSQTTEPGAQDTPERA